MAFLSSCQQKPDKNAAPATVKGWNILSDNYKNARKVIDASKDYDINHLQLSHQIIMDLKHAKDSSTAAMVRDLTRKAHQAGINEVTVWDHALYSLDYYPDSFKTSKGLINLDDPGFWRWVKEDYRFMLDQIRGIDGIILTFIETGAHVEDQYSEKIQGEAGKLAALVDTLAKVIMDERGLQLYIRTFIYTRSELESMLGCINQIKHEGIRVMTKETPHDFFLTHPVSRFVQDIKLPTIIEFDAAHEYNGQGIIASIFPETHLERWEYYRQLPNVIGYVARTDRTLTSTIIGTANEINLFALDQIQQDPGIDTETVYDKYIEWKYSKGAIEFLKPAFKKGKEIITSVFYTLGLNTNSHSRFQYNDDSAYQRHVSGKWLTPPVIIIGHGVNQEFHYWKDIVNHLAPAWYKGEESGQLAKESRWVLEKDWLQPEELMNEKYLKFIVTEKDHGVQEARKALGLIVEAKPAIPDSASFEDLYHLFERTFLTAKLYRGGAKVYYGYRVFARGEEFQVPYVKDVLKEGLEEIKSTAKAMIQYPYKGNKGQYVWVEDAYRALEYYEAVKIRESDEFYPGFFPYFSYQHKSRVDFKKKAEEILNGKSEGR